MQQIETYKITWRPCDNAGTIHIGLADGSGGSIPVDSPQEMTMLVDILRHESPVYWDPEHCFLMTGFEPVGEGNVDADAEQRAAS